MARGKAVFTEGFAFLEAWHEAWQFRFTIHGLRGYGEERAISGLQVVVRFGVIWCDLVRFGVGERWSVEREAHKSLLRLLAFSCF